ncbi:MAG: hypothetical protein GY810_24950 [Aureispira sp.]|nr:hypothetical protein [Aureispira sp.]
MKPQFVFATYKVKETSQEAFIALLKECEEIMRGEKLITPNPIFRMSSRKNPQIILEIFEWVDDKAFSRAQNSPNVLAMWGKYESLWENGGFGINLIPEASESWAQFPSIL